ncbi:MAG: hypothetical protein ACREND_08120 [Gemmatimonadaceae bacterium]
MLNLLYLIPVVLAVWGIRWCVRRMPADRARAIARFEKEHEL